jgi:hypothetical protein
MITLEDLKRLRYYDTVIQSGEERIADLRRKAEGLTRDLSGMPRASSHSDKMAEYMVKLEGLEEELGRQLVEMLELEQRVAGEVERLPCQQALIMRLRYLSVRNGRRLSWREVSRKAHYSVPHCKTIHQVAVRNLTGVSK